MNRARSSLIVLLLTGVTVPASAQLGVYAGEPQSLEEAERNRQGVRISGNVRGRAVPPPYTVRRGDTLWDVTGRYYGNPWAWPRVWSYNPEVTNPHWIYPLDQLRLLPPGEPAEPAPRRSLVSNIVRRTGEPSVFLQQQGYLDREALARILSNTQT